jgi:CRP/FNR family cyclic AMP-dependent transcriptional regulator
VCPVLPGCVCRPDDNLAVNCATGAASACLPPRGGATLPDVEPTEALLTGTGLFAGLDAKLLRRLTDGAVRRTFPRGQALFYEGDSGESLHVVIEGLVKLSVASPDGREMLLATVRPGEAFGELSLVDGGPRSTSAVAVEATTVLVLRRSDLLEALRHEPALVDGVLRSMGALVRRLTEQTTDLVFLDVNERVAKLLVSLAERDGVSREGTVVVDLALSQGELAEMVGVSRQSLNQALHKLAERGWITLDGRHVTVTDLKGLRRRAGL